MIKAVIFDMDGVLIEAKDWHYEALNKALSIFGMEISRYDHLVTYDGLPTRVKLEMLSLDKGLPRELHSFLYTLKQKYTMEMVHLKCKPVFYHEYALSKLSNDGYKIVVCSNSIRNSVAVMMDKANLSHYLDFFISNEDVTKAKPDPEMYNTAISRLNLQPEECLILEDNDNGIKAALASGGNLMKINAVEDVTYSNIIAQIKEVEGEDD